MLWLGVDQQRNRTKPGLTNQIQLRFGFLVTSLAARLSAEARRLRPATMPKKSKRTGHTGHELYQLDGKRTGPWTRQTKLALERIACVRTGGLGNGKKPAGALKYLLDAAEVLAEAGMTSNSKLLRTAKKSVGNRVWKLACKNEMPWQKQRDMKRALEARCEELTGILAQLCHFDHFSPFQPISVHFSQLTTCLAHNSEHDSPKFHRTHLARSDIAMSLGSETRKIARKVAKSHGRAETS